MVRGRKKVPTEIARMRGAHKKNPDRVNHNEPKPDRKKHRKPAWIKDKHAKEAYTYYVNLLDDLGVVTVAERVAMEQLAVAYANWRRCQEASDRDGIVIDGKRNPNDIAARDWYDRLLKILVEFGLTPSSRTRIVVNKPSEAVKAINPRQR
jgi:P27 family predicted phage terminase small subunit